MVLKAKFVFKNKFEKKVLHSIFAEKNLCAKSFISTGEIINMQENSIQNLEKFWFEFLGCEPTDLKIQKTFVCSHGTLKGYNGVFFFNKDEGSIVSAPAQMMHEIRSKIPWQGISSVAKIESIFKNKIERIVGPAWIGQITLDQFISYHGEETRVLTSQDNEALRDFLQGSSEIEIQYSGIAIDDNSKVGHFIDGKVAAVACYSIKENILAHIGVLTHPSYRGQGLSKHVVSKITEMALSTGLGIQYQTLQTNIAAIKAAQSIGFSQYAETIAVRLKENCENF